MSDNDSFHRNVCCDGECRQGRDCPMCNATSFAAYVIVIVCLMLSAVWLIYWMNQ